MGTTANTTNVKNRAIARVLELISDLVEQKGYVIRVNQKDYPLNGEENQQHLFAITILDATQHTLIQFWITVNYEYFFTSPLLDEEKLEALIQANVSIVKNQVSLIDPTTPKEKEDFVLELYDFFRILLSGDNTQPIKETALAIHAGLFLFTTSADHLHKHITWYAHISHLFHFLFSFFLFL